MHALVSRIGWELKTRSNQDHPKEKHLWNQITTNASISGYLGELKFNWLRMETRTPQREAIQNPNSLAPQCSLTW